MMDMLIEPPGFISGTTEQWQKYRERLLALPQDQERDLMFKRAEKEISLREKSDPKDPWGHYVRTGEMPSGHPASSSQKVKTS